MITVFEEVQAGKYQVVGVTGAGTECDKKKEMEQKEEEVLDGEYIVIFCVHP